MLRWRSWLIPGVVAAFLLVVAAACGTDDPTPQPTPTPVDVSGVVQQAITNALAAVPAGVSADDVAKAVQAALAAQPGVTDDVAKAVQAALAAQPGVTAEEVSAAIAKALEAQPEGITQSDVEKAIGKALVQVLPTATPLPGAAMMVPIRGGIVPIQTTSAPEPVYILGSGTLGGVNQALAGMVNQLVEFDPETADVLDLRPDLAESWTISSDGRTYTLKIRQGVRFHNGDPLTMDDILFSYTSQMSPSDSEFELVKEATKGVAGNLARRAADFIDDWSRDVTALDENTLVFRLNRPGPHFLTVMGQNHLHVLQKKFVEEGKLHKFANPETLNGTGPYQLGNYNRDVVTSWERNDRYWRSGTPHLDGIDVFIITDASRVAAAYKTRQVLLSANITTGLSIPSAKQLEKDLGDQATVSYAGPAYVSGIVMNADNKPWDDPRSRKAMNLIIDRQSMIDIVSEGAYVIGTQLPCGFNWTFSCEDALQMPGFRQLDGKKHPDDIAQAQKLFEELGLGSGSKVDIGCATSASRCDYAVVLKQQFEDRLGWDVTVNGVESSVANEQLDTRNYKDIYIALTSASPPIPDISLGNHGEGNENHSLRVGVYNEEADKVLKELVGTQDIARQRELALKANNLLIEDSVHPYLFFVQSAFIKDKVIQGVHVPGVYLTYAKWDHIWCDPECK